MKTGICKCDLQVMDSIQGLWWKWIETCDRCGATIQDYGTISSEEPDPTEVDYCYECLRYLIKNKVPYCKKSKE